MKKLEGEGRGLPWLCDDCVRKGHTGRGIVALVRKCKTCKEMKCDHCFPGKSKVCEICFKRPSQTITEMRLELLEASFRWAARSQPKNHVERLLALRVRAYQAALRQWRNYVCVHCGADVPGGKVCPKCGRK